MNFIRIAIRRPIFVTCIVLLILIVGFSSLKKLPVDLFPDVTFPVVSIQTVYQGASPNDVEEQISKPIEDELASLSGLKQLTSTNLESVSIVVVQFTLGTDIKNAEQQVRDRISLARRKLPDDIEEPVIRRLDPADQPIMRLAVTSPLPETKLYQSVEDYVKSPLERINGVGLVEIIGGRKRQIDVLVDKDKLQEHELSVSAVAAKIGATSKNIPVGKVEGAGTETILRTLGEFKSTDALKKVNVSFIGSDRAVHLEDIAEIKEGAEDEKTRSSFNGKRSLFVDIYRQSGSNTVEVAGNVTKQIEKINEDLKFRNINAQVNLVRDGAWPIRANVQDVNESIILGVLLCVVVVFLFLGSFRSTVITGLALPNSLLGAFILMSIMGFSINIMTLLALSLAVGLLVDDAIVVRENIFRHLELGEKPEVAAEKGTKEVALAVVATTAVVIAIFGPIAFLDGIVGQFFKQFGLTIVFAVAISLFDALTVGPMLSAAWATGDKHGQGTGPLAKVLRAFDRFQTTLESKYEKALSFTIRRPGVILAGSAAIFFASLLLTTKIPKTFLPAADNGEFEVKLERPPGTSLESMSETTTKIDEEIRRDPVVEYTASVSGSVNAEPNKASIYVHLKSGKARKETTSDVKNRYRDMLAKYSNEMKINVTDYDAFGGGMRPFNLNVSGENLEELSAYAEKLAARMKKIPGLVDVDTNYRAGKPELQVIFDRSKAESLGIATASAGAELRARTEGVVAGTYRENGTEYDIRVRLDEKDRDLRKEFDSTLIPNVNFNMIPLKLVAEPKEASGFSQINRLNKARYIQISGDMGKGGALGQILDETRAIVTTELKPPRGVTWAFFGQAEDFMDLMKNMVIAIGLGVTFIYLVLSSLYESFIIPFTILLALPFAMTGALVALFITQAGISIFSMIGIVMLLGVVTKNSILMVDYTLQLSAEGLSRAEALTRAAKTRLRPILMTSLALIAGTIPIAIGLNEASKQRTAMGIAIIGGLVTSTLLTLIVVPAAYGYVDDFRKWIGKKLRRAQGKTEVVEELKKSSSLEPQEHASAAAQLRK